MYLGIEIGGTKLQLGLGHGDGKLIGLWRGAVELQAGAEGIRRQILDGVSKLLEQAKLVHADIAGVGIGFGGPVDDASATVIKSHQIQGWDNFPLTNWIGDTLGWPAVLGNDADVAGLAEALLGAGKGASPIFYITIGSGIGGGFIINDEIFRGCGRGAAEIGHLRFLVGDDWGERGWHLATLESVSSGWGIEEKLRRQARTNPHELFTLLRLAEGKPEKITLARIGQAIREGENTGVLPDKAVKVLLEGALDHLAHAICHVLALLCPRRIVIGGGVSLLGEEVLFKPLRRLVAEQVFPPFADCYDIVPAQLGEEVVVHGALALAHQRLGASARR